MASFSKYTLLDLQEPSLAQQIVTDITEDVFCGPAVVGIYTEFIQLGGSEANQFDTGLRDFIKSLSVLFKGREVAVLLWEALEDCSILEGIASAICNYVHSLAACREAVAAQAEAGYLISFKDDSGETTEGGASNALGRRTSAKQPAPKFTLDSTTAQALIDRQVYQGLEERDCNFIIWHDDYASFASQLIDQVLQAYSNRLWAAIGAKVYRAGEHEYLSDEQVGFWTNSLTAAPPHLVSFTSYDPKKHSGVWSLVKSKLGEHHRLRPGYARVGWTCFPLTPALDIPMGEVDALKAAIATAPKVPYLASRWANSSGPLFVHGRWPQRWERVKRFDHE